MDINTLKQARADALDRAEAIAKDADKENRNLNDDERAAYDGAMNEARAYSERIERAAALDEARGLYPADAPNPNIDMEPRQVQRYSVLRAINAQATGDWSNAQFERECSDAVAELVDKEARGFYVPNDYLEQRVFTVGTGSGDQLVETDHRDQNYIDLLRNRLVVAAAGATFLPGLVGDVAIPKASTGTTAYWVAENGAATESAAAFTQVSLSPKAVSAYQDISRKALIQTSPAIDDLIMNDLAKTIALAIDYAALHGASGGNDPTGIAATSGIGSVVGGTNGAAPDWADIVKLETEVAQDNADINSTAYITNAKVRGKLKQTEKASGTAQFVWGDGATPLNGYKALVSNQVSSTLTKGTTSDSCSAIFYGDWSQLLVGMWGSLDLMADPYSLSTKGALRLVAFQDVDVAVRYAQSFAAMLDAITT
jgi:HK97 family phage major capsid protein